MQTPVQRSLNLQLGKPLDVLVQPHFLRPELEVAPAVAVAAVDAVIAVVTAVAARANHVSYLPCRAPRRAR